MGILVQGSVNSLIVSVISFECRKDPIVVGLHSFCITLPSLPDISSLKAIVNEIVSNRSKHLRAS